MGRKTRREVAGAFNYESRGQKRSRIEVESRIDTPVADLFDENNNEVIQLSQNMLNLEISSKDNSCQTDCVQFSDSSTQTTEFGQSNTLTELDVYFTLDQVRNLISVLIDSIPNFNAIHFRIISVIIYVLLRIVGVQYESSRRILSQLRLLSIRRCSEWVNTIVEEENVSIIQRDGRGTFFHRYALSRVV